MNGPETEEDKKIITPHAMHVFPRENYMLVA
jgi:hypothetical protein